MLEAIANLFRTPQPPALKRRADAWDAARSGDRASSDWPLSPDAPAIPPALIRQRARHATRNMPAAARAAQALTDNIVGGGIRPVFRFEDSLKDKVLAEWRRYVDEADADGLGDFYELQRRGFRSQVVDGEVLAQYDEDSVRLIPAEFLDSSKTEAPRTVGGIKFDERGRRSAYWLFEHHPGDIMRMPQSRLISADEVLHCFRADAPGQVRGVSWLAPVLDKIKSAHAFDHATLRKAQSAAMRIGIFETDFVGAAENGGSPFAGGQSELTTAGQTINIEPVEEGSFTFAPEGWKLRFTEPADTADFDPFHRAQLRQIAAGIGIPYPILSGDLSDANFSSSRLGLLEFAKLIRSAQRDLVFQFCRPIYRRFLRGAILSGRLPMIAGGVEEYVRRTSWQGPVPQLSEPLKELQASVLAIRAGLKSREAAAAELGMDLEELDREIAASNKSADKFALVLDSDPRKTSAAGLAQQQQTEGENANG